MYPPIEKLKDIKDVLHTLNERQFDQAHNKEVMPNTISKLEKDLLVIIDSSSLVNKPNDKKRTSILMNSLRVK